MFDNTLPDCPAPSAPEEFRALVAERWKWYRAYMQEEGAWRPYDWGAPADSKDIVMWTRRNAWTACDSVKATAELPCSVEEGVRLALSTSADEVRHWDPEIASLAVHRRIDDALYVALSSYRLPWPLYPRRFLTAQGLIRNTDGSAVLLCTSVNDAAVPVEAGYVRGEVRAEAWLFEPLPGGDGARCRFTRCVSADPRGALPAFVLNALNGAMGTGIRQLRQLIVQRRAAANAPAPQK